MSRVDFYVLTENSSQERFVCDLTDKAIQGGNRVIIHVTDQQVASTLDTLLWTNKDISFIPHAFMAEAGGHDEPVLIDHGGEYTDGYNVLVNLDKRIPASVGQYERIVEIVAGSENDRNQARTRYREYRERNFELHTHNMDRD